SGSAARCASRGNLTFRNRSRAPRRKGRKGRTQRGQEKPSLSSLRFSLRTLRLGARCFFPAMRDAWTSLSDDQLLAQCEVDTYRARGPGGQKRNKPSSGVRLRHPPSGLVVIAEESRSQHENRARALRRLRQALYLKLREDVPPAVAPVDLD